MTTIIDERIEFIESYLSNFVYPFEENLWPELFPNLSDYSPWNDAVSDKKPLIYWKENYRLQHYLKGRTQESVKKPRYSISFKVSSDNPYFPLYVSELIRQYALLRMRQKEFTRRNPPLGIPNPLSEDWGEHLTAYLKVLRKLPMVIRRKGKLYATPLHKFDPEQIGGVIELVPEMDQRLYCGRTQYDAYKLTQKYAFDVLEQRVLITNQNKWKYWRDKITWSLHSEDKRLTELGLADAVELASALLPDVNLSAEDWE